MGFDKNNKEYNHIRSFRGVGDGDDTAVATVIIDPITGDELSTIPVSVTSLPLPAGASKESKQDLILTELQQKTEPSDSQMIELTALFKQFLTVIANPSYVDKSANAIRNQVQSGTITTVTTLTNLTNFGSFSPDILYRIANRTSWAINVRSLIT